MKILVYCINYRPELTSTGKYTGEMAPWFAAQGHDVRVITAPPYYPDWKVWPEHRGVRYVKRREDGVLVLRCPLYVPVRPSTVKRLIHLISFSLTSFPVVLAQIRWKPDLIILVVPTMFCAPQSLLLAKLTGAKSVVHVQDYEVDAVIGLGMAKGSVIKRMAFGIERVLFKAFDRVSTISSGMLTRARQKGVDEDALIFFPNWSETARFQGVERSPELLMRLGVDPAKKIVLYSGNIGEKQGLETVIQAAQELRSHAHLQFLIVGEGAGKARLVAQATSAGLDNVVFAPLQPYEDLPALLASADCHLVVQKRGAADSVLPSKLTNILAVGGNAVITADAETSLGELCAEFQGIAQLVEPESCSALVQGILSALSMPAPNLVASGYAQEYLDKERILSRFMASV